MDGALNPTESPRVTIELSGQLGKPQRFEAIVDTGFTGYISLPLIKALPLGLVLFSTASFILADGSREDTFLCLGTARIEGKEKQVVVALTKGNDVLIGTEFLSVFRLKLELDYGSNTFRVRV